VTTTSDTARGPQNPFVTSLISAAVTASEEKLGLDASVLDLRGLTEAFDALVVTSGRNDRQVRSIAEEVERLVFLATGVKPTTIEGLQSCEWVALDYGDVIVHIFDESLREYYDLEHLWSAAPVTHFEAKR
jgi:ribosome-associated protein